MRTSIPVIEIDDVIIIKRKKDQKVFQLYDIALWKYQKTISTIDMVEVKSYRYSNDEKDFNRIKKSAKYIFNKPEQVLIQHGKITQPYKISVYINSDTNKITSCHFNKMVST